ncbi:hypothetical protein E1301_Tti020426 [Triplophysa tibetana]|uniref:Uncharacterized protein n=1 Tax=Triplophysa tibetana TaxID=1572043 RepID=A0A5A9N5K3_9TELE|nr:hypothetical protein E1301_Tti020426 [Triplophysa tibetana]
MLTDRRKCGNQNPTERFCLERADVPQQLIGACLLQSRRTASHRYDNGMESIREWQDYQSRLSVARPPYHSPGENQGSQTPSHPTSVYASGFLVSPGAAERSSVWKANVELVVAASPGQRTLLSSRNEN